MTRERIWHVLSKEQASGQEIHLRHSKLFAAQLLDDIIKESAGEWPEGSDSLDRSLLVKWTRTIMGEMLGEVVEEFSE